jgi:hypothetical protein
MLLDEMISAPQLLARDMPYVTFKTETIEDPLRTKKEGRMCYKDQDFAVVTPPGGKSNNTPKIEQFWAWTDQELRGGRVKYEWVMKWKGDYELYRQGLEIPEQGTAIRGWKLLSGAQQEELLRINVRTVEALAELNDDGLRAFGMGAARLKERAQAWLAQNESKESGALKLADLTRELQVLKEQLANEAEKRAELELALSEKKRRTA